MLRLAIPLRKAAIDVDPVGASASLGLNLLVWAAGGTLVVLALAQLLLPTIASKILRHQLAKDGVVLSVGVHAFPAIQLVWGHASRIELRMATQRLAVNQITTLLDQSFDSGEVDVVIDQLVISAGSHDTALLMLHNVSFTKRGQALRGTGRVDNADLRRALPIVQSVTPLSSADGKLTLQGTANLFGGYVSVEAVLEARDGKLVVIPSGVLGSVAAVTVYSSPDIYVESVSGRAIPGGMTVTVTGRSQ